MSFTSRRVSLRTLYQAVPTDKDAPPAVRGLIDMTDATSKAAMKKAIAIDAAAVGDGSRSRQCLLFARSRGNVVHTQYSTGVGTSRMVYVVSAFSPITSSASALQPFRGALSRLVSFGAT